MLNKSFNGPQKSLRLVTFSHTRAVGCDTTIGALQNMCHKSSRATSPRAWSVIRYKSVNITIWLALKRTEMFKSCNFAVKMLHHRLQRGYCDSRVAAHKSRGDITTAVAADTIFHLIQCQTLFAVHERPCPQLIRHYRHHLRHDNLSQVIPTRA